MSALSPHELVLLAGMFLAYLVLLAAVILYDPWSDDR